MSKKNLLLLWFYQLDWANLSQSMKCTFAIAWAAIPSPRPIKPSFSVVVALILILVSDNFKSLEIFENYHMWSNYYFDVAEERFNEIEYQITNFINSVFPNNNNSEI